MHRLCFALLLTAAVLSSLPLCAADTKSGAAADQQKPASSAQKAAPQSPKSAPPAEKITPQTKMLLMRDLMAERAFARIPMPMGEKGLEIKNGVISPNEAGVANLIAENGAAAKPGDRIVISNVLIREKTILFEINGGAKKKQKWYKHIQVGMGGPMTTPGGAQPSLEAHGTTITLAFDHYVPELTGEQVRDMLSPVLDFKALNQAEAYTKTLPPKVQQAIKEHRVLVGMDRDMVIYAKGRPPRKIRDKDDKGQDYEEWIYGDPPQEVDFVRFVGPVVARLEIMTVDGQKIVRTEREVELPSAEETQVAEKKGGEKPDEQASPRPTLRRPGEVDDSPHPGNPTVTPTTPYPGGTVPGQGPDSLPPQFGG